MNTKTWKWRRWWLAAGLTLLCAHCSEPEPVRLGFIGGTSGRVADLGVAGRNGVILAVEQRNAAGGINGRRVELLVRDDQQNAQAAERLTRELIEQKTAAIIGPMTSAMAVAIVPIVDQHHVLLLSPTVTTNELSGKDDYFFRAVAATRHHASISAEYQLKQGLRTFAITFDVSNRAYSENWMQDFRTSVERGGGKVTLVEPFFSSPNAEFPRLAGELVAPHPDGIVLICNSVDAALFAQHIRKLDPDVPLVASEWSGTERLLELGGRAIEGLTVPQYLNRHSKEKKYVEFRERYRERFGQEPGFPGMLAHNAAVIVLNSLTEQRPAEDLKATLLRLKTFPGIQQSITFDEYGDTRMRTYITRVRDSQFMVVE